MKEPDLHVPFRTIVSQLVLDARIVLGMLGTGLVEQFWDGTGTTILSSKYMRQKPDLLSLWGPVPSRANTKGFVEFKIEAVSNNAGLSVISEDSLVRNHKQPLSTTLPQRQRTTVLGQKRRKNPGLQRFLPHAEGSRP